MRQKWGQNFLTNQKIAERIVRALPDENSATVLEIGPGRGILTQFLLEKTARLTVVELDQRLSDDLKMKWPGRPGFQVVCHDFLKWPLPDWPVNSCQVIGNLPYSAGNAIVRKFLDWQAWETAVIMVQKEVADRMKAGPGTRHYGILSLAVQSKARVEKLFDVSPGCFHPPPKVMSTVLKLRRFPAPLIKKEEEFFQVVHAAFSQRRKTLVNSLSHGLHLDKTVVTECLEVLGINPVQRAETLTLNQFDQLSQRLMLRPV